MFLHCFSAIQRFTNLGVANNGHKRTSVGPLLSLVVMALGTEVSTCCRHQQPFQELSTESPDRTTGASCDDDHRSFLWWPPSNMIGKGHGALGMTWGYIRNSELTLLGYHIVGTSVYMRTNFGIFKIRCNISPDRHHHTVIVEHLKAFGMAMVHLTYYDNADHIAFPLPQTRRIFFFTYKPFQPKGWSAKGREER